VSNKTYYTSKSVIKNRELIYF